MLGLLILFSCLPAMADTCANLLLRQEILVANRADQHALRQGARVSNFIENRAREIDSTRVVGSHVVSLGSGPDIYLPMYLYPHAKYFHLVDVLTGWGNGPDVVVHEIRERLKSLNRDVTVEESGKGYALVWKISWNSPAFGRIEKFVYLHQMNFQDLRSLKPLLNRVDRLGGIVITGIGASLKVREFLLARLHPGGSMFTEMVYVNEKGESTSPDDLKILEKIAQNYEVMDLGRDESGFKYNPTKFLIRPRR